MQIKLTGFYNYDIYFLWFECMCEWSHCFIIDLNVFVHIIWSISKEQICWDVVLLFLNIRQFEKNVIFWEKLLNFGKKWKTLKIFPIIFGICKQLITSFYVYVVNMNKMLMEGSGQFKNSDMCCSEYFLELSEILC